MKLIILCAMIGALLGSGLAYTQSTPTTEQAKQPKYLTHFEERFRAADKDGDGALNQSEAQAAGLKRIADHFDQIDLSKDGKVTLKELRDALRSKISS